MDLTCRTTRLLFEAAEGAGIPREDLTAPLGVDAAHLSVDRNRVQWDTLAALFGQLSAKLDDDPARLRAIGAAMVHMPTWKPLRTLARGVFSVQTLYATFNRWLAPTMLPHLPLAMNVLPGRRMRFTVSVPEPYVPCPALFYVFQGQVLEAPRLLGLPPSELESTFATERFMEFTVVAPRSVSMLRRAKQAVRAAIGGEHAMGDVGVDLEEHREELQKGFGALQRSSEELHGLLEALPDIVIIHREGKILWANRSALAALRYSRAELIARTLFEITDEASRAVAADRMREPAGSASIPERTDARLVRSDGEILSVEVAPTQAVTFRGAPARLVVGRDVTERVRMQQRLVIADRLASIGMLAAGVAHEINNPLAYVLGNIEIATRDLLPFGERGARARESLEIALEGVGRIRGIVRDLLLLARADERGAGPVDVRSLLDSTLSLAASAIAGRARVVRDDDAVPPVHGDGARLGQVFLNLVVNAVESMSDGAPDGHVLRIRTAPAPGDRVCVEISDTGAGIPPELVARIFDPFFTTKPIGRGTGLGLAICERIVTELGGEISVESAVGRGSTFRVLLRASRAARPSDESAPPAESRAINARILVVDDEPRLLDAVRATLTEHHVVTATGARAALDLIAAGEPFDVVMCDLMMPEVSGMDLYAALQRTDPAMCERVVFMTGGACTERARDFLASTPNACIDKPFDAVTLRRLIAARLEPRIPPLAPPVEHARGG
jgi:PAS domain S-box-containing protein